MNPSLLVRLRPVTPWRIGPESGAREQASAVFPSDTLFSALCGAFSQLGWLEEWLSATVGSPAGSAVRLTSAFPFQRGLLYLPPPAGLWPPAGESRVRWKGAAMLPAPVVASLLDGAVPAEDEWSVDAQSACLVPSKLRSAAGPFRFLRRSHAAVDRLTGGNAEPYTVDCVQFAPEAGLWCAADFSSHTASAVWSPKLKAAFRLLADSGFGGLRSRGFGRCRAPLFQAGILSELLLGENGAPAHPTSAWWTLSLFSPAEGEPIEWDKGCYHLVTRSGRATDGRLKRSTRLIREGSVLVCGSAPRGAALDVAPDGSPHPLWRSGFAVSLPIAWKPSNRGVA
jgi:CRISPR type III-A-associated RAMP protein Csm4